MIQRKCLHRISNGDPIVVMGNFSTEAIRECRIHVSRFKSGSTKMRWVAVRYRVPMVPVFEVAGYRYRKRTFSTLERNDTLVRSSI